MNLSIPIIFLSGAGGGSPDLNVFRKGVDDATNFEVIGYPDWQQCTADGFSPAVLIEDIAAQIVSKIPHGPIRIVGLSLGGHLGYALGVHFQANGREIAGLCAIDSFMFASSEPSAGWKGRALEEGFELLRKRRVAEFGSFVRSKFWRAMVRLAGSRLPGLVRKLSSSSRLPTIFAFDPTAEKELSMRLLVRELAPWLGSVDREPVALRAPSILLRTPLTSGDDDAWRRRCPSLEILEIKGQHHSLFEPEYIDSLREAFLTGTRHWR
jgi:thioesterase domain-containing protein